MKSWIMQNLCAKFYLKINYFVCVQFSGFDLMLMLHALVFYYPVCTPCSLLPFILLQKLKGDRNRNKTFQIIINIVKKKVGRNEIREQCWILRLAEIEYWSNLDLPACIRNVMKKIKENRWMITPVFASRTTTLSFILAPPHVLQASLYTKKSNLNCSVYCK